MATAVEPTSTPQPRTPNAGGGLVLASLVGAVYVLATLAIVLYLIPTVWAEHVTPRLGGNTLMDQMLRTPIAIAALVALWYFGRSLAGSNPPKGLRGGIFLMISAFFLAFFLGRAVGLRVEGGPGQVVTAVVVAAVVFGAFRLFASPRGERWMVALEEQGWFHGTPYKRVLGRQVRRLTILGILLVGVSGVYSLMYQNMLPDHWDLAIPFTEGPDGGPKMFRLLPDARFTAPLILIGLTLWVAYRAVNMPAFAEFLIATEAEMNKVSWSSRRRLAQDTVVVLICTVFMALFLLFVDLFWGWLLSREVVGVLPGRSQTDDAKGGQVRAAKW
jgi:preprotein translocase SecE subunit